MAQVQDPDPVRFRLYTGWPRGDKEAKHGTAHGSPALGAARKQIDGDVR